jgi:hypothetical protein
MITITKSHVFVEKLVNIVLLMDQIFVGSATVNFVGIITPPTDLDMDIYVGIVKMYMSLNKQIRLSKKLRASASKKFIIIKKKKIIFWTRILISRTEFHL